MPVAQVEDGITNMKDKIRRSTSESFEASLQLSRGRLARGTFFKRGKEHHSLNILVAYIDEG